MLSGVQPTGELHLGNYLGAIRGWVGLQASYDAFFCVVDLHAITLPHDPRALAAATRSTAALYLAAGIDPEASTVFVQSHVAAHSELAWLLNCTTPVGWLQRMIQFKEKSRKADEAAEAEDAGGGAGGDGSAAGPSLGLLSYPVLMAADILAYASDVVPVGEDQLQHLELTRDVAARFNALYGGKKWKAAGKGPAPSGRSRGGAVLRVPEALIAATGARVMSLTDGRSKMSKSAPDEGSRIGLLDSADTIRAKIRRCKTDGGEGVAAGDDRPEATNLLAIYSLVTNRPLSEVAAECASLKWSEFKPRLADAVVAHLEPLQARYAQLTSDQGYLDGVLADGAGRAAAVADATLADVRDALGYLPKPPRR